MIISDQADAMLDGARARAAELGLANVEFQVLGAEWIDLPLASVDAVLCRWGYMLLADPAAALAETRRVLRPRGRAGAGGVGLRPAQPVGAAAVARADRARARRAARAGHAGPVRARRPERVRELLEQAGFAEIDVQALEIEQRHPSFEVFWETTLDISRALPRRGPEPARAPRSPRSAPGSPRVLRPTPPRTARSRFPRARCVASATA